MLPFENLFIQGQKLFIQTQILLLMYLRRNSRGALRAPVEVRGKVHTAEAAAAPAAAGSVTDCHATVKHAN